MADITESDGAGLVDEDIDLLGELLATEREAEACVNQAEKQSSETENL